MAYFKHHLLVIANKWWIAYKEVLRMSEECLVRHCAPTLAGIKTASLFTYPYESWEQLLESVRKLNNRFKGKGLRVLPLRYSGKRGLIYIYRPKKLSADLSDAMALRILRENGYHICLNLWSGCWTPI